MYEFEIWNSGSSNTLNVQQENILNSFVQFGGLINNNNSPPIRRYCAARAKPGNSSSYLYLNLWMKIFF
jgi:hypothetical protein